MKKDHLAEAESRAIQEFREAEAVFKQRMDTIKWMRKEEKNGEKSTVPSPIDAKPSAESLSGAELTRRIIAIWNGDFNKHDIRRHAKEHGLPLRETALRKALSALQKRGEIVAVKKGFGSAPATYRRARKEAN